MLEPRQRYLCTPDRMQHSQCCVTSEAVAQRIMHLLLLYQEPCARSPKKPYKEPYHLVENPCAEPRPCGKAFHMCSLDAIRANRRPANGEAFK